MRVHRRDITPTTLKATLPVAAGSRGLASSSLAH
jgi:hypothetical protein